MTDTINPTVSIGMPVYNGAKYIKEALDSLLAQTYTDFELIISDNASTDSTQAICEEYASKDSRIRYIRQNENIGALGNFQFVLDESVGEYFMWAAHDDVWSENWIQSLVIILNDNQKAIGAYGKLLVINEKSEDIYHIATNNNLKYEGMLRRIKYYFEPEIFGKANVFYSLFRKSILKRYNILELKYDYEFLYSFLKYGNISVNKVCFLKKRIHSESLCPYVKKQETKFNLLKLLNIIKRMILDIDSNYLIFLKESNKIEIILITILYPLKKVWNLYLMLITYKKGIK